MLNKEAVLLRPHHGLCLGFFEGYGYSDGFSKSMAAVLKGLEADTPIRIAKGQDCICANCPNLDTGCPNAALYDQRVLELCGLQAGQELNWSDFRKRICGSVLAAGKLAEVCGNCEWFYICGKKV